MFSTYGTIIEQSMPYFVGIKLLLDVLDGVKAGALKNKLMQYSVMAIVIAFFYRPSKVRCLVTSVLWLKMIKSK